MRKTIGRLFCNKGVRKLTQQNNPTLLWFQDLRIEKAINPEILVGVGYFVDYKHIFCWNLSHFEPFLEKSRMFWLPTFDSRCQSLAEIRFIFIWLGLSNKLKKYSYPIIFHWYDQISSTRYKANISRKLK